MRFHLTLLAYKASCSTDRQQVTVPRRFPLVIRSQGETLAVRQVSCLGPVRRWIAPVLLLELACLFPWSGCTVRQEGTDSEPNAREPAAHVPEPPRLLLVGHEGLATTIRREWLARSGQRLEVQVITEPTFQEWIRGEPPVRIAADAVIYPCGYVGELFERGVILAAPDYVRGPTSQLAEELAETDILPGPHAELLWGKRLVALPLGSAPLLLAYRQDVLMQLGRSRPETWPELHELARALHDRDDGAAEDGKGMVPLSQPLGGGWAARLLLARVAASVRDPRTVSDVLDAATARPLIAEPPFVQALESLVADQQLSGRSVDLLPEQVWHQVAIGQAALGVCCWPVRGPESPPNALEGVGFVPLPGSNQLYSVTHQAWSNRSEIARVPLWGSAGHVASVVRGTRRQRATWSLLLQLSGRSLGTRIALGSDTAGPFRSSQLVDLRAWFPNNADDQTTLQLRSALQSTLGATLGFQVLRIPHAEAYLNRLDQAVLAAVAGDMTPEQALTGASHDWDHLLSQHGRNQQAKAYLRHLGIEP